MTTMTPSATPEYVVEIDDIGPHTHLEIRVSPGVTVVAGESQTGKSTAVRCVACAASGDAADLDVRDGQPSGMIRGFGTTMTIARKRRQTGARDEDIDTLSDRLDLGTLVNPGLKNAEAAQRQRIRALLSLTQARVTLDDFRALLPEDRRHELAEDLRTDDPSDFAAKVKRALESKARHHDDLLAAAADAGDKAHGRVERVDFSQPHDEAALSKAYQDATQRRMALQAKAEAYAAAVTRQQQAQQKIDAATFIDVKGAETAVEGQRVQVAGAERALDEAKQERDRLAALLAQAEAQVVTKATAVDAARELLVAHENTLITARQADEQVAECRAIVEGTLPEPASQEEIDQAAADQAAAERAVTAGSEVRKGLEARRERDKFRQEQAKEYAIAEIYRHAALSTDDVLLRAVASEHFQIHNGILSAYDDAGVLRPFEKLSEGGKWKLSILAAAEAVGGSRLVIVTLNQEAWDGLTTRNRDIVARHAEEFNVAIVTGEKADTPLMVYRYVPSEPTTGIEMFTAS